MNHIESHEQTRMDLEQLETQRIREYGRGWNDAYAGRAPKDDSPSYALGFMDAIATTFA